MISLAGMVQNLLDVRSTSKWVGAIDASGDDAEDLLFTQDDVLDFLDLHFRAGVLSDQDAIPDLHLHRDPLSVFVDAAGADGHDLAFERLLFRGVGDDDSTLHLLFSFHSADQNAV